MGIDKQVKAVYINKLFELSEDLLSVANKEGYFELVSPSFFKTFGWTEEELMSKPFMEFIHPEDVEKTKEVVGKLAQGKKLQNFINRFVVKGGGYKHVSWNSVPEGSKFYTVSRDITEEQEERENSERLNKAMLNRELKMIELKEEIYKLRKDKK